MENNKKKKQKNYPIYINPQVYFYFNKSSVVLKPVKQITVDASEIEDTALDLVVTTDPIEAISLKSIYNCEVCFVNNHNNDYVDFMPTYEIYSEEVPHKLQKFLLDHQNRLKKNRL